MYTSALDMRDMSRITAVSHVFYKCVVHFEAVSVIVTTQVCFALFTHYCCLADFVWVVSVAHSGMCVLVTLVTCRTDNTGVALADSSHWPVVSVVQTGWWQQCRVSLLSEVFPGNDPWQADGQDQVWRTESHTWSILHTTTWQNWAFWWLYNKSVTQQIMLKNTNYLKIYVHDCMSMLFR